MERTAPNLGYFRITCGVPPVRPADPASNGKALAELYKQAASEGTDVVLFPELSLTGYTPADLFNQEHLLREVEEELVVLLNLTKEFDPLLVVGLPLSLNGLLFNAALVLYRGKILGAVPKSYLPNNNEFYEQRWFAPASALSVDHASFAGQRFPFQRDLIFQAREEARFSFALELCEDLWSPLPPGTLHSLAGASVVLNLSASNELVGKHSYRRQLISQQSARCLGGYAYVSAGPGESTTDTVYSGRIVTAENGHILEDSPAFNRQGFIIHTDFDVMLLDQERRNSSSYRQTVEIEKERLKQYKQVLFPLKARQQKKLYHSQVANPFVPGNPEEREDRCREIFAIQSEGLVTRLKHIGCKDTVIGLSGGLDSTLALLVLIEAYKRLELPLSGIHCYTMPGFGTTDRTKNNAQDLCKELKIPMETVDIREVCEQQLKELKHSGKPEDVAYENVQARQRTMFLMNKANMLKAIVIGTGDLSELALGWCTYNGDHISMYAVNTGVPKTLVRYLVDFVAHSYEQSDQEKFYKKAAEILRDIVDTPISPELLPPDKEGNIAQKTEDTVGPYELHDFFLYQGIRNGFPPAKVLYLAELAWGEKYEKDIILKWLKQFYQRFFSQQFKRSCLPDGPKVGTIALSPRGDWRMPSDAPVRAWLDSL